MSDNIMDSNGLDQGQDQGQGENNGQDQDLGNDQDQVNGQDQGNDQDQTDGQDQEEEEEVAVPTIPEVALVNNNSNKFIGYACQETLQNNIVTDIDLIFYVDMANPPDQRQDAMEFVQKNMLDSVASRYGISSGDRCEAPPLDGTSWLVQFLSDVEDYSRVEIFDSCRELEFDDFSQECFVYELKVTGSILGGSRMPDVLTYLEDLFAGGSLTTSSEYSVGFLGVPVEDPSIQEGGRDNLSNPTNLKGQEEAPPAQPRQTITIVGGLLVAAFCFAFIGIILVLIRRRRQYLHDVNALMKEDARGEIEPYDTEPHASSDDRDAPNAYDGYAAENENYGVRRGASPREDIRGMMDDDPEQLPNNITFDLGTSFKDQLMGVHGHQPPMQPGIPGRHGAAQMMAPYGSLNGRRFPPSDASESDADSWAQTDGTIGSLESHLEPITAEV